MLMASPQHAFVTLISSDAYLPGALAQVAALSDLHDKRDFHTLCLVTPESVDVATIRTLRKAFDVVVGVEILEDLNDQGLKLLGRPDLTTVLTKLHVFRLTQYSKIIFLDADVLPLKPLDHLFDLPHEFSAVPDVGWPDIFNSGVLVLSPGEEKFEELNQLLKTNGSWDGGDQGLLNEWRGGNWHRLSFTYNTTPTAAYTYAPAYERFGSDISALHFIGKNKPWNSASYRAPFTTTSTSSKHSTQQAYDYDSLVDRWYAVYDKHYRSQASGESPSFEFTKYTSVWDESRSSTPTQHSGALGLDELRKLTVDGVAITLSSESHSPGEAIYYSLPLEGRVDLMRPRKPESDREEKVESEKEGPSPPDRRRPGTLEFELEDMLPATPQAGYMGLYGDDEEGSYRWHTLPTPNPNDVPPSPHMQPVSLPPTPTPHRFEPVKSDFYASESEDDHGQHGKGLLLQERQGGDVREASKYVSRPGSRPLSRRASHSHSRPPLLGHLSAQFQDHYSRPNGPSQHQLPDVVIERRSSPSSNSATGSTSAHVPTPSLSTDTYFPNVLDQPKAQSRSGSSQSSINFFKPPPRPVIPEALMNQYKNVTGDDSQSPSPDRTKVKSIFPWEERPRALPNRVFPDADAPPPGLFPSPSSPSQTSTAAPSTPEQPKAPPLARLNSLSKATLTYSNAWDTVPSIQKYASRLVEPPRQPTLSLVPAFDDDRWRKPRPRAWDDRLEANGREGDDGGNADDEEDDDDFNSDTNWDDSDTESGKVGRSSRRRSLSEPSLEEVKQYCDRAVQTELSGMEKGSQTEKTPRLPSVVKRHSIPVNSPSFLAPPATRDAAASTSTDGPVPIAAPFAQRPPMPSRRLSIRSGHASPIVSPRARSPMRSPVREFIAPSTVNGSAIPTSQAPLKAAGRSPTINTAVNGHRPPSMVRQVSNDSSLTTPTSSTSGYPDYEPQRPFRVGGRVFDPARGVEIFKRGSEEVLARFLKMGPLAE
ncbi:glycogenin glucosyltransferase [Coprinopsis sp. MPI-PUGE-AT-0042]|nr:glycogenin glucosyltransferase [Coprinopsis sp. MPI-PUGE-AT-0042]